MKRTTRNIITNAACYLFGMVFAMAVYGAIVFGVVTLAKMVMRKWWGVL